MSSGFQEGAWPIRSQRSRCLSWLRGLRWGVDVTEAAEEPYPRKWVAQGQCSLALFCTGRGVCQWQGASSLATPRSQFFRGAGRLRQVAGPWSSHDQALSPR